MQTRTVEQVESWDARPFSGQTRELHELADDGFSGTVVADDTWAFFLNGRVVGSFQGEIEDVVDVDGTVYTAPDPSLPLLFSMQERGGETRAKYFTNDTPLEEVDETLREANFTGYLELSENVLSGDYYVSYYGGKSLSTAFVGQSERLVTGEEAFEMASDEVGVYEVRDVSFGITELPKMDEETGPKDSADDSGAGSDEDSTPNAPSRSGVDAASSAAAVEDETDVDTGGDDPTATSDSEMGIGDAEAPSGSGTQEGGDVTDTVAGTDTGTPEDDDPADGDATIDSTAPAESSTSTANGDSTSVTTESTTTPGDSDGDSPTSSVDPNGPSTDAEAQSAHERAVREWAERDREQREAGGENDLFRAEEEWRKTNSIPALDPDESGTNASSRDTTPSRTSSADTSPTSERETTEPARKSGNPSERRDRDTSPSRRREDSDPSGSEHRPDRNREASSEPPTGDPDRSATSADVSDTRIEQLESELATIESKRDELETTVSELREERSSLENRIDTLESKLETAERGSSSAAQTGPGNLSPSEAIAGTNVFVRYDSKGKPTLDALDGTSFDPDTVNENLRLDHHTTFDASEATVDGRPFERFLQETSRYRFVEWLVRELPYELLDSGGKRGLETVYEAIPAIDRVEFAGTIDVESSGAERSQHAFDVVVRDRMGNPLIVADSNDDRDPVDEDSMDDLVSGATAVGTGNDSLAGAFYVTTSYFDPEALERAQNAADEGGFFSRGGNESFVKVGRKRGFHLCLVEDRQDSFHVTVPEL
ncbi:MAG: hypothetical protein ABEJ44_02070 [Halanaeroarchaeum sp.]